jgi:hypothetical protein
MAGPNPLPMSFGMNFDVIGTLPSAPGGADRLRQLREHVADLLALTVPFADIREASQHSRPPRWLMCSH